MKKTIGFHHGALADSYEKQAAEQGFTLGENKGWIQSVGDGIIRAHMHGCITDAEYDKILRRFHKKYSLRTSNH